MASFDKAIPPGQEGKITLKVQTARRKGKFSKGGTVHSNDPQQQTTTISIGCLVKTHISVIPTDSVKLEGYEGDKLNQKITITSFEDLPLQITDITSDIDDKIKYKLKTKKKGKEYVLEIKNRSKEVGSFRGKINLKTNSDKKPLLVINVYGKLREEVAVRPGSLSYGTLDTTKENFNPNQIKKTVVLRDVRGNGLTIKKVKTSSDWIVTETKTKKEGKQYSIVITLVKDKLPKGQFNETIEIRTNYKRQPLVVDVKGEVI